MDGEEMADNALDEALDEEINNLFDEPSEESTPPVEEKDSSVDTTKAFSKRLKEETEKFKSEETSKIRNEERQRIAESFGYESWDEFVKTQTDNSMLNKGFDPEEVRPLFESFKKNDPEYQEAMKYKKEKEELEQKVWAQTCLNDLNSKFGTTFTDINDLDKGTIDMFNQGIPLDKAYAANNYTKLTRKPEIKPQQTGKEHMTKPDSSAASAPEKLSEAEMKVFRMFNPDATEEDILKFKNAQK